MQDDKIHCATQPLARREFLVSAGLFSTSLFLPSLRPLWAAPAVESAGEFGELNATSPGGIDLYLEHRDLLIGGTPGSRS